MDQIDSFHSEIHALLREVSAKAILPRYQSLSACDVANKAVNDVVTVADLEAEAMLAEGLAKIVPGLPVVGEEGVHADATILSSLSGSCWIVDPLDGTNNFAAGKPPFGILLAMAEHGVATTGWIYDPLADRLCIAHRGKGAFINGERIFAKPSGRPKPIAAISIIFMDQDHRDTIRTHIAPHYELVDIPRCAAEQYPRLALGVNDVSIFEKTHPWDHAAGALFLNEAGGKVARPDGSEYRVDDDRKGLIGAATPQQWDQLAERLAAMPQA